VSVGGRLAAPRHSPAGAGGRSPAPEEVVTFNFRELAKIQRQLFFFGSFGVKEVRSAGSQFSLTPKQKLFY